MQWNRYFDQYGRSLIYCNVFSDVWLSSIDIEFSSICISFSMSKDTKRLLVSHYSCNYAKLFNCKNCLNFSLFIHVKLFNCKTCLVCNKRFPSLSACEHATNCVWLATYWLLSRSWPSFENVCLSENLSVLTIFSNHWPSFISS